MDRSYAVITPVRDEEEFLSQTIGSVAAQQERPGLWVIVDDGSTDATPDIIRSAAARHPWIQVHTMPARAERVLGAGVVNAFNAGLSTFDLGNFRYISKLDADLQIHSRYFALLMDRMEQHPRLGIASGQAWVRDRSGVDRYERGAREMSIGQAKFYRVRTFRDIGGLAPKLAWDAIDSHEARLRGWKSRAFDDPDLRVVTLRPEGASDRSVFRGRRRRGRGQWILGTDPLFMLASAALRILDTPRVTGSAHILYGYAAAALQRVPRHGEPGFGPQIRRFQRETLALGKERAAHRFEKRTAHLWPGSITRSLAVLSSQHPTLSHTFISREIAELRFRGWLVTPISLRPGEQQHAGEDADTVTVQRLPVDRVVHHLARALAHPVALTSGLIEAILPGGRRRPRLIGLAYLGQAILLLGELRSRRISHVHVHFANNGAEVARLAEHVSRRDATGWPISYSLSIHGLSMHGATADADTDKFPALREERWGTLASKVNAATFTRCVDAYGRERVARATERDDVEVVHVGIDTARFAPVKSLPAGPIFTIGFVGRLAPEKQVLLLLDAFSHMRYQPRRLVIMGNGPLNQELRNRAGALGLEGQIDWRGPVSQGDLPESLRQLDVLAMSSRHEGIPVVLMEALACAIPVVAPEVGGIPELVRHDHNGLLTPPNDHLALASALDKLAANPELRSTMGFAGRATVQHNFDSRDVITPLESLLMRSLRPVPPSPQVTPSRTASSVLPS